MLRALLFACTAAAILAADAGTAATRTFSNATPIAIPASGDAASPYPSGLLVSGLLDPVETVTVTLRDFGHTWPADVDVLLVGPEGQNLLLMSDVGAGIPVSGVTLVFSDAASSQLGSGSEITSGTWLPSNQAVGLPDAFPPPAPALSGATLLEVFAGTDPNGEWSLYVVNDSAGDAGQIAGGWSLTLPEPGAAGGLAAAAALLALGVRGRGARRRA